LTLELFFHDTQKPLSLSSVHYLPNPEVEENSAATRRIVLSFDSSLPSSTFSLVYATMAGMNNAQWVHTCLSVGRCRFQYWYRYRHRWMFWYAAGGAERVFFLETKRPQRKQPAMQIWRSDRSERGRKIPVSPSPSSSAA